MKIGHSGHVGCVPRKISVLSWGLIILCSVIHFVLFPLVASADSLKLRGDQWCPINCARESDKPGYMIDIARAVFEPLGHTVDYDVVNWTRAMKMTRDGDFTAVIGASKLDARDFIFPEQRLGADKPCVYTSKESTWVYTGNARSLEGLKTIGVVKDYCYGQAWDLYLKSSPVNVVLSGGDDVLAQQFKLLRAGRIDAFLEYASVVTHFLMSHPQESSPRNAGCESQVSLYIAFSPTNPNSGKYASELSEGVISLRKSGKLQEIYGRYGITDPGEK